MKPRTMYKNLKNIIFLLICLSLCANATLEKKRKAKRIGKDVRDMSDADLEHLLDQWEEDDDPLEADELPEHLRPQPKIDLSQIDMSNPDDILRMSKKGKSVMMFVDTNPELSEREAEDIMKIWQSSLQNNHIVAERYPIDKTRAIFMFRDGAQAVDAKNFLIEKPECSHVTLEGQNYPGKYASMEAQKKLKKLQPKATVEKMKKPKKSEL